MATTLPALLPDDECERLCARFDAMLEGDEGDDNGDGVYARVRVRDEVLAARLGRLLSESSELDMEGLHVNDAMFFTRYAVGGHLEPHVDGTITGDDKRTVSVHTLLVYVNEAYEGGETVLESEALAKGGGAWPRRGDALVLAQDVLHEALPVTSGTKYVLRGDIMSSLSSLGVSCAQPPKN
jgi:predicted 2-oxoglutarate/Fe(II)-dependent dioxygenase YbiX